MKGFNYFIGTLAMSLMVVFFCFAKCGMVVLATEEEKLVTTDSGAANENDVPVAEITGYSIEDGVIKAGKDTAVVLNIHNTSKSTNIRNLVFNASSLSKAILPAYGSNNQVYIGTLSPDETKEITLPITLISGYIGDYADLQCELSYSVRSREIRNTIVVALPTMSSSTLEVRSVEVSPHATVGTKTLICINLMNNSTSNIADATMVVKGNVSSDSKNIKLGTLYAGKGYSEDFQITMTELGTQEVGIVIRYTDSNGSRAEADLGTFNINVEKEIASQDSSNNHELLLKMIGLAIAAVGALIAIYVTLTYIVKR